MSAHEIHVYWADETEDKILEDCDTIALRDGKGISEMDGVSRVDVILVYGCGATAHHFMDGQLVGS